MLSQRRGRKTPKKVHSKAVDHCCIALTPILIIIIVVVVVIIIIFIILIITTTIIARNIIIITFVPSMHREVFL